MRFQKEGEVPVIIRQALLAEPKFAKPPAFDVVIEVEDAEGHKDWWRGEVSQNYGKGNFQDRTQATITMDTLAKLGLPNNDLSQIGVLVDVQTVAYIQASESKGKTFYNVRGLGEGQNHIQELSPADLAGRIAALFGTPTPAAAVPAPAAVSAPKGNPFAASGAAPATRPNPFAKR